MKERDWKTVAANYRERIFWVLVVAQMYVVTLLIIPNESFIHWAKDQMGSWYHHDYIWLFIYLICFGCILIISKTLEKLIFLNLEH